MRVVAEWKLLLRHALSVHFNLAGIAIWAFVGFDSFWSYMQGYTSLSPIVFAATGAMLHVAPAVLRFVAQPEVHTNE